MNDTIPLTRKEMRQQAKQRKIQEKESAGRRQSRNKKILSVSIVLAVIALIVGLFFLQKQSLVIVNNTQDPYVGPLDAKVVVAEYADFQCPACAASAPVIEDFITEYSDRVRFEYNDFPLPQHEYAPDAAIAAQCVYKQNKFFEISSVLFSKQREWSSALTHESAQSTIRSYVEELGLNMDEFDACVVTQDVAALIDEDMKEARKAGVNSTPTFFVNGKRVVDTPISVNLKKAIDEALAQQ